MPLMNVLDLIVISPYAQPAVIRLGILHIRMNLSIEDFRRGNGRGAGRPCPSSAGAVAMTDAPVFLDHPVDEAVGLVFDEAPRRSAMPGRG